MNSYNALPVAIIGAGPVGLAAAAHLKVRNQPFLLFEAGSTVAANILSWKHIRVFSPWRYNIDKAARKLLEETNWQGPDDDGLPTGAELYDQYFRPLAELTFIKSQLHLNSKVLSIGRKNIDKMKTGGRDEMPYLIQVRQGENIAQFEAKAIIDASGTWNSPNPIGSGGVYAIGELENASRIFYGIPDILNVHSGRYKNKSVLVVGSGHSSINTLLELDKLKEQYRSTEIHWVLRKKKLSDVYGGQDDDALEARGALGLKIEQLINHDRVNVYTPFQVHQIINKDDQLTMIGWQDGNQFALEGIDEVISNTGSRPDFSPLREVRLNIDASLESVAEIAELIDPNIHSCGTVRAHGEKDLRHPDKNFYIVGSKSYGRAPTFLMATGYEQVRSIAAAIDGDMEAAQNIELDLPETGVCSSDGNSPCCGVAAKNESQLQCIVLRLKEDNSHGFKAPLFASLSLAFASFGDAFLYPFLPVNHMAVGLPVTWVGILLSVNRFVRIFANTWIVQLLARYGLRVITIAAATLALISTAGYAFASGLWLWLLLRIGWGLAFSALRLSTIGYSLQQSQQGFALGLTRGVQEAGPMSVLFLSPLLLHYFSATDLFIALAALSLPSIYFAWNLPAHHDKTTSMASYSFLQIPSLVNIITFISAFTIEGVIVVVLGILFLNHNEHITLMTATLMAAFYLGYRRVCLVLFSPLSGWIADRVGLNLIFNGSLFMMLIGLFVLAFGSVEIGAILTFTFYSIHAAVAPGYVSTQQDHPLASVAENATWRDMGAAMGTLAGGLLLSSNYLNYMLIIVILSLALLFLFQMGTVQRAFKFLYLWK